MKKNIKTLLGAGLLLAAALILVMTVFLSEPARPRLEYYSQDSSYISATGTVTHIGWGPEQSYVYLSFAEIPEAYSDTTFVLEGENLRIVLENGFAEKVEIGTEVVYISAPRYFWDGYAMPVVALEADGETLLLFEEGKANLLDLIKK